MDSRKVAYIANMSSTLISFIHLATHQMIAEIMQGKRDDGTRQLFLDGISESTRLHRQGKLHLISPGYTAHCLTIMSKLPQDFLDRIDNEAQFDRFVRDDVEGHA